MLSARGVCICLMLLLASCRRHVREQAGAEAGSAQIQIEIAEMIYSGGFRNEWKDSSGPKRTVSGPGSAAVEISQDYGWTLTRSTAQTETFGALAFKTHGAAPRPDDVEAQLKSKNGEWFPVVRVHDRHVVEVASGWQVVIPFGELNPHGSSFENVILSASRPHLGGPLLFDEIGLTKRAPGPSAPQAVAGRRLAIDCLAPAPKISPLVYGFSYYAITDKDPTQWGLGATIRRWGGNTTSRYNWELGNAWNTGRDWYYQNVETDPYTVFLDGNREHGLMTALTVPTIGWVAKDTKSFSFPVSVFGAQQYTDAKNRPDSGNGISLKGKPITPKSPTLSSVPAGPDFIARWVRAIQERDRINGARSVDIYMLDNEPALWSHTHRDVHPDALTYDELLERTIAYGSAIRAADPQAKIAGPAAWGWPELFYSAKDSNAGLMFRPDRRAHGDVPLLPWYLRRLREEEQRTKTHILDYVDVHYYPQSEWIYGDTHTDPKSAALRIRSTRSLWDRTYTDESYINEPVYLLPRLHAWIAENFPGRGIIIGEWNFGGERHMSGALATAEVLGRFTQHRVAAAFYWTVPPAASPTFYAFKAYRDFDGHGGKFLDYAVDTKAVTMSSDTKATEMSSLFASRDLEGRRIVAIALNFSPQAAVSTDIDLASCGEVETRTAFVYAGGGPKGFVAQPAVQGEGHRLMQVLPPYSITVLDVRLASPIPKAVLP